MTESKFQTYFSKWARHQSKLSTGAFELKLTKGKSLPFNAVKGHQLDALYAVKHNRLVYKIADDSIGFKPFDCFMLREVPAFVVISFYTRGEKKFYMIDVDNWISEIQNSQSNKKSITQKRAAEIGLTCLLNKDDFVI